MAKVYKVTMYVTDYNDVNNDTNATKEDLAMYISNGIGRYFGSKIDEIKESEEFEWRDDLKINLIKATSEDFEEYFKDDDNTG